MFATILSAIEPLTLLDWVFGWTLRLPRDMTLLTVTLATVAMVTLVRRLGTDQDLLGRCRQDLLRLKQLRRDARRSGDREALERMSRTSAAIKRIQLRADLVVLAWSIVPLGLLAWWAASRLEYLPVRAGDEVTLKAYFSLSAVDRLTHLVPPDGGELLTPAICQVEVDAQDATRGAAEWRLRATSNQPGDLRLTVRNQGHSVEHPVRVGDVTYHAPLIRHGDERITETAVMLREFRFLGIVPGIPGIGLAPWIVAYLALSLALMPIARRLGGVA